MAALAEQAGVTETFISQFERGNKLPTLSTLDAIATALGTTVADLLQGVYPWGAAVPPNERPAPPPDGRSLRTRPPRS